MSLFDLVANDLTDKNNGHFYLSTYEQLFKDKKFKNINILEIGIHHGGSIKLWRDYFINAHIYGIDINDTSNIKVESLKTDDRVTLITNTDAYSVDTITNHLKNTKFDIIIDDGTHHLEDMISFIRLYLPLLTDDGIFVIEDIKMDDPNISLSQWIKELTEACPDEYKQYIKVIDLVHINGRFDDILFIIDKSETTKK